MLSTFQLIFFSFSLSHYLTSYPSNDSLLSLRLFLCSLYWNVFSLFSFLWLIPSSSFVLQHSLFRVHPPNTNYPQLLHPALLSFLQLLYSITLLITSKRVLFFSYQPETTRSFTTVIMSVCIKRETSRRRGLKVVWLQKRLIGRDC